MKFFILCLLTFFNISLKDKDGKFVSLDSLYNSDKYIVMVFWHVHCNWCPKVMDIVESLSEDTLYKDKAVFIGICTDSPRLFSKAVSKINTYGWKNILNLFDFQSRLKKKLRVVYMPTLVIFKKGKGEIFRYFGWSPKLKENIENILNK